jgi:hypothetical protein
MASTAWPPSRNRRSTVKTKEVASAPPAALLRAIAEICSAEEELCSNAAACSEELADKL